MTIRMRYVGEKGNLVIRLTRLGTPNLTTCASDW